MLCVKQQGSRQRLEIGCNATHAANAARYRLPCDFKTIEHALPLSSFPRLTDFHRRTTPNRSPPRRQPEDFQDSDLTGS